jgi:hypothetical protein
MGHFTIGEFCESTEEGLLRCYFVRIAAKEDCQGKSENKSLTKSRVKVKCYLINKLSVEIQVIGKGINHVY